VLALTLYFTFSRGAIGIAIIAIVVYVLVGRPRGLPSAALAIVPATAIALKVAYDANVLATADPTSAQGVAQGHHVTAVLAACVAGAALIRTLALQLDRRLLRVSVPAGLLYRARRAGWASAAVVVVVLAVGFNGAIAHEWHRFVNPAAVGNSNDLRTRLTDPGNNGRIDMWRVAWHGFKSAPVVGQGAGMFANTWTQERRTADYVVDAHSLYVQTLDELGIVGFLLIASVILIVLGYTAARIRGPSRALYAAVFAVLLALAIHTGVDWDWQMPVITVIFFALGGLILARPRRASAEAQKVAALSAPGQRARVLIGLGCLLLAVAPTYIWLSQRKLGQAVTAFGNGNCPVASREALSSISLVGVNSEPYEIVSYCDIRRNQPRLALTAINEAISLDPKNYSYTMDLALVRAAAGLNPLVAARKAVSLNPLDPLVQEVWQTLHSDSPSEWEGDGKQLVDEFTSL
jgi:O-Antigen ligase